MLQRIICIYIFLLFGASLTFAQKGGSTTGTKSDLQTKREQLLQEIANAQSLLNDVKANQKVTLTQLNALNKKLGLRKQLITNINQEISTIGRDINLTQSEIEVLNKRLAKYRMEYARSVRYAYKNKESQNMMLFVFSADNFNEMMRRMEYMKKYREYRTLQANRIREIQGTLTKKVNHLAGKKNERNSLLSDEKQHEATIQSEANQTSLIVQELKGQVTDLSSQIAKNRKAAAQLESAIKDQIRKEIAEAKRQAEAEAKRLAIIEAKRREAEEIDRKARETADQLALSKQRAIEEEQRKAAALEKQAETARKNAAISAERQKQQDIADAKRRREEAAAEEKRIADAKSREEQRKRNEERNKEIDKRKEQERQIEIAKQKKLSDDLEKQQAVAQKNVEQYKSGATVVTVNNSQGTKTGTSTTASTPTSTSEKTYKNILPQEAQNLSASFEANKGSLPWPVDRGVIVAPYGNYQHPLEKSVTLNNQGIDIGTNANAPVKAVFGGLVTKIFNVPGMGVSVLVNHGSYYTLYSKLSSASVAAGARVSTKQVVGTAGTNDEGDNVVHFELWKVNSDGSFNTVNPSSWISPR